VVETFEKTWEAITQQIASLHIALGVATTNIAKAAFEQGNIFAPPYVLVGAVPGDWTNAVGGRPLETRMTVEVFCATAGGTCNADRIAIAHDMGALVLKHFLDMEYAGFHVGPQPIVLDTIDAMMAAVNIQFSVPYAL
jgi:hypothetical protein